MRAGRALASVTLACSNGEKREKRVTQSSGGEGSAHKGRGGKYSNGSKKLKNAGKGDILSKGKWSRHTLGGMEGRGQKNRLPFAKRAYIRREKNRKNRPNTRMNFKTKRETGRRRFKKEKSKGGARKKHEGL